MRFLLINPLRTSIRSSAGKRDPGLLAETGASPSPAIRLLNIYGRDGPTILLHFSATRVMDRHAPTKRRGFTTRMAEIHLYLNSVESFFVLSRGSAENKRYTARVALPQSRMRRRDGS
jgi:hypothetical protein